MLGGAGHPVGQLGCAPLAAALNSKKDQTHSASGNDQDHEHCNDDGGHDIPFRQSMEIPARGRNCLTGSNAASAMDAAYRNSSRKLSLPNHDHAAQIDLPILALDFITTLDRTLISPKGQARQAG
jgi:hypothetical protein